MKTYALPVKISTVQGVGYRAECTILPGCFVDGDALQEVLGDIQEAIALYIAASKERGLPLPALLEVDGTAILTLIPVALP